MNKKYINPEATITVFECEDVITVSGTPIEFDTKNYKSAGWIYKGDITTWKNSLNQ